MIVAVAVVERSGERRGSLVVYGARHPRGNFIGNTLSMKPDVIALSAAPLCVRHVDTSTARGREHAFVVSCGDGTLNMLAWDWDTAAYRRVDPNALLPELVTTGRRILSLDVSYDQGRRFVVAGCEDGYLHFSSSAAVAAASEPATSTASSSTDLSPPVVQLERTLVLPGEVWIGGPARGHIGSRHDGGHHRRHYKDGDHSDRRHRRHRKGGKEGARRRVGLLDRERVGSRGDDRRALRTQLEDTSIGHQGLLDEGAPSVSSDKPRRHRRSKHHRSDRGSRDDSRHRRRRRHHRHAGRSSSHHRQGTHDSAQERGTAADGSAPARASGAPPSSELGGRAGPTDEASGGGEVAGGAGGHGGDLSGRGGGAALPMPPGGDADSDGHESGADWESSSADSGADEFGLSERLGLLTDEWLLGRVDSAELPTDGAYTTGQLLDGPVMVVKLAMAGIADVSQIPQHRRALNHCASNTESPLHGLHLLVGGGIGFGAVFERVADDALRSPLFLDGSDEHDTVTCMTSADLNWDGQAEILVGTFDCRLLVYGSSGSSDGNMRLLWQRRFPHPVYDVVVGDYDEDGAAEIVVVTLYGVHVLYASVDGAAAAASDVAKLLGEIGELEEELGLH